ncbi:MAG: sugar phosphate isomerase/epimerase [Lentisphaeria bacterium]|nr:sugar phosphate isomerase/epimerase [Lentisphaeria bacterium]
MRICMMSLMMDECPVEEIIATAKACNMEAIDWITLHGRKAAELKKLCDDAGLPIVAHTMVKWGFVNGEKNYFDEFKASLDDACTLGAKVLMLPPFARREQTSFADDRKRYAEYFARAFELSSRTDVTLTLESTGYGNSPITTADECLEIVHQVPGLKITFDQGNTATAEDPVEAYKKLREHVVHFHLKDWSVFDCEVPGSDKKRCGKFFRDATIGEGDMDIASFWAEVSPAESRLFVNPETRDYTGKRTHLETFRKVCDTLNSYPCGK